MSRQQWSEHDPEDMSRGGGYNFGKTHWTRIQFYATYVWRFLVLQHPEPLIYGIALTDRCNLQCRGCHVSNTGRRNMTWKEVVAAMQDAWRRGFRELYFSGGEPMLWHDKNYTLSDAIRQAKQIGFFHVHVYTNGLLGIERTADLVWVSMDGLPGVFDRRRGNHFQQVETIVRTESFPKVAVIYVIDRNTAGGSNRSCTGSGKRIFLWWGSCSISIPLITGGMSCI